MLINQIINVTEDFGSGDITEPVTLQQAKDYLRLGGFESDESGEQDFDFDDTLIEAMIQEGRMWLERFTGQYIVPRSLSVVLLNQAGGITLPGPVSGSIEYENYNGDRITDSLRVIGDRYPKIITQWSNSGEYNVRVVSPRGFSIEDDYITASYEVGYSEYPDWVKNGILAYVAWAYENRGDEAAGSPERAAAIARPHKRKSAWA
jgi:uncharacterized phiE125 gp8 family phage protein